jgi:hypothetical protein
MDLTSDEAGKLLGIAGGALRSIELELKPVSLALAFKAERLYSCPVDDLLRGDGEQDKPKKDEKAEPKVEPTAPPGRKNGKGGTAPKRVNHALKQAS